MRAVVSAPLIDMGDEARRRETIAGAEAAIEAAAGWPERLGLALAPHAVYTASEPLLRWVAERAGEAGLPVHTHLSETRVEVDDAVRAFGRQPVAYLDGLGLLSPRLLAAHCVHLTDEEIALLAERGVHALHNPVSNLKLASGGPMRYRDMKAAGVSVLIGTDGAASNNNLDLLEEMKFAALLAKHATGDPTVLPADEALALGTTAAGRAFGLGIGRLEPGMLADIALVDLANPYLFPGHDLVADLVYSAHGRAVVATICDGQVLMEGGVIPDEAEIRQEVAARLAHLTA
jgi:5-methylthioadenosine/S-adenosylhomocysteine deaminase